MLALLLVLGDLYPNAIVAVDSIPSSVRLVHPIAGVLTNTVTKYQGPEEDRACARKAVKTDAGSQV